MQKDSAIKDRDTSIILKKLIIMQQGNQLNDLDSTVKIKEKQLEQTTNQIIALKKENKILLIYKNLFPYGITLIIIETLIIIFK